MAKFIMALMFLGLSASAMAGDPTIFFDWKVTYGTISPLGVPQQGILINGAFPGPDINATTNNNVVVNVFNQLDEPLLITWAGIQHRKNSWVDGTAGTMCPIAPGTNFTYRFQVKDQIGTYFYFPTTGLQRASGAFGMLKVHSRAQIPIPFKVNASDEFSVLTGDWYKKGHKTLQRILDSGRTVARPDGVHINGKSSKVGDKDAAPLFTMEPGNTYRYRICNVGLRTSVNFRLQGHSMTLVEMEGSHTVQNVYDSLDLHVGQCMTVLVKADQEPKDYYLVVSSRFLKKAVQTVGIVRYANGKGPASPELPPSPPDNTIGVAWSINQFRSFRWNLTASAARPNPQGSFLYGKINITRTIKIANSRGIINGKLRFALNNVSHVDGETPLKLAQYFGVSDKVFTYNVQPNGTAKIVQAPHVMNTTWKEFVEIVFENREKSIQTYNIDGYSFFAVAIEAGKWTPEKRKNYNLLDAVSRHSIQVYPNSWAAVLITLDNAGMWNLRSDMRERAYLGQQLYISSLSTKGTTKEEYNIPDTQLQCGAVKGLPKPKPYTTAVSKNKPKKHRPAN